MSLLWVDRIFCFAVEEEAHEETEEEAQKDETAIQVVLCFKSMNLCRSFLVSFLNPFYALCFFTFEVGTMVCRNMLCSLPFIIYL